MPRTNKDFAGKRTRLLSQLWNIFLIHGYQDATLALIINELGISKGVFYHYFDSKEQCAQAAVDYYSQLCLENLYRRYEETAPAKADAAEKFRLLIQLGTEIQQKGAAQLQGIHSPANRVFHQMLMASMVKKLTPAYTEVFQEGAENGLFCVENPQETAEMILTLSNFYLDQDLFGWTAQDMPVKIRACQELIAKALGVSPAILF